MTDFAQGASVRWLEIHALHVTRRTLLFHLPGLGNTWALPYVVFDDVSSSYRRIASGELWMVDWERNPLPPPLSRPPPFSVLIIVRLKQGTLVIWTVTMRRSLCRSRSDLSFFSHVRCSIYKSLSFLKNVHPCPCKLCSVIVCFSLPLLGPLYVSILKRRDRIITIFFFSHFHNESSQTSG